MAGTYVGKTTEGKTCKLVVQNKNSKGEYGAVYTVGGVTTTYAASKLDRVKYAHYGKYSGGNNNTEDTWAMLTKVQYGTTGRIAFDIDQYKASAQDKSKPLKRVVEAYNASTNTLSTCYINPQPAPAVVPTPKAASHYNFASCNNGSYQSGTWNLGGSDIRHRNNTHCMTGTYLGKTTDGKMCKLEWNGPNMDATFTVDGKQRRYKAAKLDRVKYAHWEDYSGKDARATGKDIWSMLTKMQYGTGTDGGRISFDIDEYKSGSKEQSEGKNLRRVIEAYDVNSNTVTTCHIAQSGVEVAKMPAPKPASNYNFASCNGGSYQSGTWNLGGSDIRHRNNTHCMTGTYLGKTTDGKMCTLELNGPGMDATFTANGKTLRYKASSLDRVAYTHGNEKSGNNDIREGDDSEYMRTQLRFGDTGRLGISIHSYLRSAKDKTKPLTKVVEAYDAASKTTATCYVDAAAKPVAQSTYDFASCSADSQTWALGGGSDWKRDRTHCMTGTYLGKTTDNKMCKLELHGPGKLGAVYEVNGVRSHFAANKLSRVAYQYGAADSGNNDTRRGKDSTAMLTQMHFGANTSVKVDMKQYLLTAYDTSKPLARQLTVVQGNKTSVCNLK